jgi:hypothetical protein
MPGKRWGGWAVLVALVATTGCCRFCDRWCERQDHPVAGYSQPACVPCGSVPVCCPPSSYPSGGAVPAGYVAAPQANYAPSPQANYAPPLQQGYARQFTCTCQGNP